MSSREHLVNAAWQLVEELYVESLSKLAKDKHAALNEAAKRTVLKDFAKKQAVTSKRWAQILEAFLSAELND
jgi:hypothetical protein